MLPRNVLRENKGNFLWETVECPVKGDRKKIIAEHRLPLNTMLRKYMVNTPARIAAFFGNAMQETQWLFLLHEGNDTAWYAPWDGRGFLQLTHPYNYMDYWRYLGRHIEQTLYDGMKAASATHHSVRDDDWPGITDGVRNWRDALAGVGADLPAELVCRPSDSAGFYWAKNKMAQYADKFNGVERKILPTNMGKRAYYHSSSFRDASAIVNLPAAVGNPDKKFKGYEARCVSYAQVLAILVDQALFADANGKLLDFPDGMIRRTE